MEDDRGSDRGKDREDEDGPSEEERQEAQERYEEVMDAPPEEHAALQAKAAGATMIVIGAIFIVAGVIIAFIASPWGWAGVGIGVIDILVGLMISRRTLGGNRGS